MRKRYPYHHGPGDKHRTSSFPSSLPVLSATCHQLLWVVPAHTEDKQDSILLCDPTEDKWYPVKWFCRLALPSPSVVLSHFERTHALLAGHELKWLENAFQNIPRAEFEMISGPLRKAEPTNKHKSETEYRGQPCCRYVKSHLPRYFWRFCWNLTIPISTLPTKPSEPLEKMFVNSWSRGQTRLLRMEMGTMDCKFLQHSKRKTVLLNMYKCSLLVHIQYWL
jgi:hypothetical protein